jgi:hypothetical protein
LKINLARLIFCACFAFFPVSALQAQETPQAQAPASAQPSPQPTSKVPAPDAQKTEQEKTAQEKEIERKEQSQRLLGVVPHFGVTDRQDAPPLKPGEKFHLFAKAAFDPVTLTIEGLQAALSQAEDEFPGYGQGMQGYGKRLGATVADGVSSGFFSNYFYSVLLKEDPRYFRLGHGTFKHRFGYAVVQEFVCHKDSGGKGFSFENVLGAFSSGGLSNVYYPSSDRGLSLTMSRSAIALGYGSVGGLVDEFWPDISRRIFKKHNKPAEPAP